VLYLEEGRVRYLGDVPGFLAVANPDAVKLPFEVVLDRVRRGAGSEAMDAPVPGRDASSGDGATSDETPRLEFQGVRAGYDGREILHGVDARLGAGEVVAVLGPNGSGKTTLFRTAMRLMEPSAGEVRVDGRPATERSVAQLATTFGFVFQSPSQMLFARTVREELEFGPRHLGRDVARLEGIVTDALRRTGLEDLEEVRERPPLTLSFGQQKRLSLAIALALEPPTLLLDEPSAGQDHRTSRRFMRELLAIPGLESVYFVTHDVDLALAHANRILLFRAGEIIAQGPPAEVIEDEERWISCNLRVTSLMRANRRYGTAERFLDSEALAATIRGREGATTSIDGSGVNRLEG
jgi:energy-coupling factor transport system ATP-binding protein